MTQESGLSVNNGRLGRFGSEGANSSASEIVGHGFEITDGPNKWRLITTFGNMGEEGPNYVVIHYDAADGRGAHLFEATVHALAHKDKYAESWTFSAETQMLDGRRRQISGTYSTRTRKGFFRVVSVVPSTTSTPRSFTASRCGAFLYKISLIQNIFRPFADG